MPFPRIGRPPYRFPVYLGCTLLVLAYVGVVGKDMAWDMQNYHLYAGLNAVTDRFDQDYFAAGPQSYFNPYLYAPFYALVKSGLPALAIGAILAVVHSMMLWLAFELMLLLTSGSSDRLRLELGLCAIAFTVVNPVLLQQFGSSFADVTTAELVLAGWLLLIRGSRSPQVAWTVASGLLLGAVTALKPTNALYAVCALPVLAAGHETARAIARRGCYYCLALAGGFILCAAPWGYRLAARFGNPFFPLLNSVFRSPEFTSEPLRHFRFLPGSLLDALWRPFAMIEPVRMIHEELRAPDLRYALLMVLAAAVLLQSGWRSPQTSPLRRRVFVALACGFTLAWGLWLGGSGNSRYFLPMSCIAAVLLTVLLHGLTVDRPKLRGYVVAAALSAQLIQLYMGGETRWTPASWSGAWFDITLSERLRREPNLFLTLGPQSNSFLAPFVAPASGFANFSGGYPLAPGTPNGARLEALLQRFTPHIRVLVRGGWLYEDADLRAPRRSQIDSALARYDLAVDMQDCEVIAVNALKPDLEITVTSSSPAAGRAGEPRPADKTLLVSCAVVPHAADQGALRARQRAVDLVFDRLEDACPALFQPRRTASERDGDKWQRLYMNTDLLAWISHGWVKFQNPTSGDRLIVLGRERDWSAAPQNVACARLGGGHYTAHIVVP